MHNAIQIEHLHSVCNAYTQAYSAGESKTQDTNEYICSAQCMYIVCYNNEHHFPGFTQISTGAFFPQNAMCFDKTKISLHVNIVCYSTFDSPHIFCLHKVGFETKSQLFLRLNLHDIHAIHTVKTFTLILIAMEYTHHSQYIKYMHSI